jgi:hypothetical protein
VRGSGLGARGLGLETPKVTFLQASGQRFPSNDAEGTASITLFG